MMRLGRRKGVLADRVGSPPGKSGRLGGVVVDFETLPTRRADGLAIDYESYEPSRYYIPSGRRHVWGERRKRGSLDGLGLDLDSVKRRGEKEESGLTVEARIGERIAELKRLLGKLEELGDAGVLDDLVNIHAANAAKLGGRVRALQMQLDEARRIAGVESDVTHENKGGSESRGVLVRKMSGKPRRHLSGRAVSAIKARSASMRGKGREERQDKSMRRLNVGGGEGAGMERASRKPSARLKRLGSAGGMLIRRLSRVSIGEERGEDVGVVSTFDADTMKQLQSMPERVLREFEMEVGRVVEMEREEAEKERVVRGRVEERRRVHRGAMGIVDRFYGSFPGWEKDDVAVKMLPDVAEMTEAGLEAERDLVEMRSIRDGVFAAWDDHERSVRAIKVVTGCMSRFVEGLEGFVREGRIGEEGAGDLVRLVKKSVVQSGIARQCSGETGRVVQVEKDLIGLQDALDDMHGDMNEIRSWLQVAKAILCDAKLAETFVTERVKLIAEDLQVYDTRVERCEDYVLAERVALLDALHPNGRV